MINDFVFVRETFISKLYGSIATFTLERQLLLWILLFTCLTCLLSSFSNFALGIPTFYTPLCFGLVCLLFSLLTRQSERWATRLTLSPFLIYMIVATASWFSSAGITGSTPMFLLPLVLSAMILLRGRKRSYVLAGLLLHFSALTSIQQLYPATVHPYPSLAVKQADLLIALTMVICYSLGSVALIIHHLAQRRRQAEHLLLNILPLPVAESLKYHYLGEQTIAHSYTASIMFIDIVNFTALSATMQPRELVTFLNELFSHFDMLADAYGVEKIKTIGDCYMVAAGVPYPRPDHAHVLVRMALTIQSHMRRYYLQGYKPTFRIGINSGPVVAGIIGKQKFIYDLWGDAVNVASRMESQGTAGAIQITQQVYQLVAAEFICVNQGTIEVKGKGPMAIWHVTGVQPSPVLAPAPTLVPNTPHLYRYREAYSHHAIS